MCDALVIADVIITPHMPREGSIKKVAKKVAKKKVAAKKTPAKKRAPGKAAAKKILAAEVENSRKAPVTKPVVKKSTLPKVIAICLGAFVVISGVSVVLGMSDDGEINVASVVEERKQTAVEEGDAAFESVSIPTNNVVARVPNGGLRGKGKSIQPKPKPKASSTTAVATTTVNVASSTELAASSTAPIDTEEEVGGESATTTLSE